jgi:hypothetical protein
MASAALYSNQRQLSQQFQEIESNGDGGCAECDSKNFTLHEKVSRQRSKAKANHRMRYAYITLCESFTSCNGRKIKVAWNALLSLGRRGAAQQFRFDVAKEGAVIIN